MVDAIGRARRPAVAAGLRDAARQGGRQPRRKNRSRAEIRGQQTNVRREAILRPAQTIFQA